MTSIATFWDKIAPKYAADPIKDMEAYEYTLGRTRSYIQADDRVLEIGCGTGSTAILLAPSARDYVGTDISPGMLAIAAERKADADVRNVSFRVLDAHEAANLQEPFDVVCGFSIFHLVQGVEEVFAGIHRTLPTGGYFISKTVCLADPSLGVKRFLFRAIIPLMRLIGKAPWVRFFTHRELEDALRFAGFEIVESGNFPAMARYIVARKR